MNRKIILIDIFIVVRMIVSNLVHPVTPAFLIGLDLPNYMFGLAFSFMAFTNFMFSPFWGKISKNVGDMKAYGIAYIGYGIGQLMFANATTIPGILTARIISGSFVGGLFVNELIYIVNNSKPEDRGRNLAISGTLLGVAPPFGYLVGGLIGEQSIKLTFIVQVVSLISIGLLTFVLLKNSIEREKLPFHSLLKESNPFRAFVDVKSLLNKKLVLFFIVVTLSTIARTAFDQSFNYYLVDIYKFSPSYNGYFKAVVGLLSLIVNSTICMWIVRKTNIHRSYIIVLFSTMLSISLMVLVNSSIAFIGLSLLNYGIMVMFLPLLQAKLSDLEDSTEGVLLGFFNSMKGLGSFLGSLFIGFIYVINPIYSFVSCVVILFIAILIGIRNLKNM
jgi:DHA1 family multidrug resistance protein-like MFS transporter